MERRAEDCAPYQRTPGIAELVVRPTGLIDPKVTLKPLKGQIDDLINECRQRADAKERVLVTTLKAAKKNGGDLRLAQLSPRVKEVLELSGLLPVFQVYADLVEAVGSF